MAKAYTSGAVAALHESMADLEKIGMLDTKRMREFDQACLTPVLELSPAANRRIRTKAAVSQAVFAAHLNVTTGVVLEMAKKIRAVARLRGCEYWSTI